MTDYRQESAKYAQRALPPRDLAKFRKRIRRKPGQSSRLKPDPVQPNPSKVAATIPVFVRIFWTDETGKACKKTKPWSARRPATQGELNDWLEDYFESLRAGYRPAVFTHPPIPHCARLIRSGKAIAEIFCRSRAESLVTALSAMQPGGVPVAVPAPPREAKPNIEHQGLGQAETIDAPAIGQAVTSGSGQPVA